jgi:hypothetical protein
VVATTSFLRKVLKIPAVTWSSVCVVAVYVILLGANDDDRDTFNRAENTTDSRNMVLGPCLSRPHGPGPGFRLAPRNQPGDLHVIEEHLLSEIFLFEHVPVSNSQENAQCMELAKLFHRFVAEECVEQMDHNIVEVRVCVVY